MLHRLTSAALAVLLLPALGLAQEKKEENPFRNAKVGDWASYNVTTSANGQKFNAAMKMEVTAKDDKNVTFKTSMNVNGMDLPGQETKVDLTKPFDPLAMQGQMPKDVESKVEKSGEGKEKIKVGGKEYETNWTKVKSSIKAMGMEVNSEMKFWISKDVPVGGLVKMETSSKVGGMAVDVTMELKDSGNAKK
jgi:hypothetical protein